MRGRERSKTPSFHHARLGAREHRTTIAGCSKNQSKDDAGLQSLMQFIAEPPSTKKATPYTPIHRRRKLTLRNITVKEKINMEIEHYVALQKGNIALRTATTPPSSSTTETLGKKQPPPNRKVSPQQMDKDVKTSTTPRKKQKTDFNSTTIKTNDMINSIGNVSTNSDWDDNDSSEEPATLPAATTTTASTPTHATPNNPPPKTVEMGHENSDGAHEDRGDSDDDSVEYLFSDVIELFDQPQSTPPSSSTPSTPSTSSTPSPSSSPAPPTPPPLTIAWNKAQTHKYIIKLCNQWIKQRHQPNATTLSKHVALALQHTPVPNTAGSFILGVYHSSQTSFLSAQFSIQSGLLCKRKPLHVLHALLPTEVVVPTLVPGHLYCTRPRPFDPLAGDFWLAIIHSLSQKSFNNALSNMWTYVVTEPIKNILKTLKPIVVKERHGKRHFKQLKKTLKSLRKKGPVLLKDITTIMMDLYYTFFYYKGSTVGLFEEEEMESSGAPLVEIHSNGSITIDVLEWLNHSYKDMAMAVKTD